MILQPALNPLRQRAEISYALQFVIRQLDIEMLLQPREKAERLQTIYAQFFEKIIVGQKALPRDFELCGGKLKNFVGSLLLASHGHYYGKYGCASVLSTNFFNAARTVARAYNSHTISTSCCNSS